MIFGFLDVALLILRFFVGVIFLLHSIPKFKITTEIAAGMKKSKFFVFVLGLVEFVSALVLIFGFYTKIGAFALLIIMFGALYHKIFKWKVPFISMNGMGWEFDLILLGANLVLLAAGAGSISFDSFFNLRI